MSQLSLEKAAMRPQSSSGASPSLVSCCHLPVLPSATCQECVGFLGQGGSLAWAVEAEPEHEGVLSISKT